MKLLLDKLKEEGRCIDLFVVTHIDDDHIVGICKWFEMDFPNSNFVKQVWMNDDIQIDDIRSLNNSASNAISVVTKLRANGVEYRNDIVKGVVHTNDFCTIRVLTPKTDYRNVIAQK